MKQYLILDFGKVLAGPSGRHWFVTPAFDQEISMEQVDETKLMKSFGHYGNILDRRMLTEKDEYQSFKEFYKKVLEEIQYPNRTDVLVDKLAADFTWNDDKYIMYQEVPAQLERLSKQYHILLLSDNWPSVLRVMKRLGIHQYFEKIYISSQYGCKKEDGIFFDYPIQDFNIDKGKTFFVDDNPALLKIAKQKGLPCLLMDRTNQIKCSDFPIITDLTQIP